MGANTSLGRLLVLLVALQSLFTMRTLSAASHGMTEATVLKINQVKESHLRPSHRGGDRRAASDDASDELRQLATLISSERDEPQSQAYDALDDVLKGDDDDSGSDAGDDYYDGDDYDDAPYSDETARSDASTAAAAGSRKFIEEALIARFAQSSASTATRSLWHKGPHVCKRADEYTQEVAETAVEGGGNDASSARGRAPARHHTEDLYAACYETDSAYHCRTETFVAAGKKLISTFVLECCDGYRRVEQSCVYVRNLTDLASTARRHDGGLFAKEATRLYPWIGKAVGRNVTVFAPLDKYMAIWKEGGRRTGLEALLERHLDGRNKASGLHHQPHQHHQQFFLPDSADELVPAHVVDGYAFSRRFENDMLLETHWPATYIRINVYGEQQKLITANCLPLKSVDNLASNGLLHVVDGIVMPSTVTIWQKLLKDKRFSQFAAMIAEEFPDDKMGLDHPGHYTVFVPTNAALENAKAKDFCTHRILKRHVLPKVICSQAIANEKVHETLDGSDISLQKLASGAISLSGRARVLLADIMATNGVIHIVDDVLRLPEGSESKASTEEILEFNNLVRTISATKDLTRNVTLFIPSRKSFGNATKEITETILEDPEELTRFIKYHVAPGITTCDKFSNQINTSLGIPIRMQTYATYPFDYVVHTANCVRILRKNIRTCRSIVHEVEEVLVPPTRSIIEIIESHQNLSFFSKVLRKSAIYEELASEGKPYTVYAPDDKAMESWLTENHDDESFEKLVLRHTIAGYKCCAGVFPAPYYTQVENEAGRQIKLLRDASGTVHMSGDVAVLECDMVGTNGVVHVVDKVIPAHLIHMSGRLTYPYYGVS